MTIDKRNDVLVIGNSTLDAIEFSHRDLNLKPVRLTDASKHYGHAKAIIVADAPGKFLLIKDCYSSVFLKAEDYGLAQVVLVHSNEDLRQVDALRKINYPNSNSKIFLVSETWRAAQYVACHPSTPNVGDVVIDPPTIIISEDVKLLLRRAFSDCDYIFLKRISGGKASMAVFCVYARLPQSIAGPRPLPFFVKIAEPNIIEEEKNKYLDYAENYIPFNLRPNLNRERCVRTSTCAALVGNFVNDAIPLRQCLRLGQGIGALFSLFETSLKGFRLQPFAPGQVRRDDVLPGFLKDRIRASKIAADVVDRAKELGLSRAPAGLENEICQRAEKIPCLIGPCHGDLHSGNIMVRGGDAILIDFSSAGDGPLTADPAALEVSLIFGTDEADRADIFGEWRTFTDHIYEGKVRSLRPPALSESKPGLYSWLRRSIRELRHILLGCEAAELEAKLVLASYLMRYARLGLETFSDECLEPVALERHAYALVVAERIVEGLADEIILNGNS